MLLGDAPEAEFDALVRLFARQAPGCTVWLAMLDEHHHPRLKAHSGVANAKLLSLATELAANMGLGDTPLQQGIHESGRSWAVCHVLARQRPVGLLGLMSEASSAINADQRDALREAALLAGALLDARLTRIHHDLEVSEQTRAADKLRLSEELYRSVALAISDGLLVVTPALGILAVNPAACDIVGAEQMSLMNAQGGFWPFELLGPDADPLPADRHPVSRVMANDRPLVNEIHTVRRPDGQQRWVALNAHPLQLRPEAQTFAVVLTFRDITQERSSEQALRDKQAAEMASHAKSEFLSRMSHEMRTPLNAVIGFAQLLNLNPSGLDSATVRAYADHVLEAGQHLLALIDDVLDLQKIEEGALSLQLHPVDLHDAVTRTSELLMPLAQTAGVSFELAVPPATWVRADMQRLRQVLLNIGSNAIKYNHRGGTVRWRFDHADGRPSLCIEDTGPGMTDEQMARLFQPFERLGRETSTIEGTGLGLIIARSLVQAIGGRLSIASSAGAGTSVRIELQAAAAPASASGRAEPVVAAAKAPALRMLYVEDNRINAILFEEAMRLHGDCVELRVAEDGDQAVLIAGSWHPEVLVLDAHLPGASGFDVLRLLRALPGLDNVPAYMCSADAMPDDVQRAYEAGFVGYWTKPINVGSVLADVEQCLQRSRGTA
jgi:PAS domain S-box-containing protein